MSFYHKLLIIYNGWIKYFRVASDYGKRTSHCRLDGGEGGFEPPIEVLASITVQQTAAFSHSATSPEFYVQIPGKVLRLRSGFRPRTPDVTFSLFASQALTMLVVSIGLEL